MLLLKDAFTLYSETVKKEMSDLKCNCKEKFSYKSSDARDLFLRNLPLILLYGGSGSYLIRRSSTINWEGLINDIEWPGKDRILKQSIKEKMKGFLRPALK